MRHPFYSKVQRMNNIEIIVIMLMIVNLNDLKRFNDDSSKRRVKTKSEQTQFKKKVGQKTHIN